MYSRKKRKPGARRSGVVTHGPGCQSRTWRAQLSRGQGPGNESRVRGSGSKSARTHAPFGGRGSVGGEVVKGGMFSLFFLLAWTSSGLRGESGTKRHGVSARREIFLFCRDCEGGRFGEGREGKLGRRGTRCGERARCPLSSATSLRDRQRLPFFFPVSRPVFPSPSFRFFSSFFSSAPFSLPFSLHSRPRSRPPSLPLSLTLPSSLVALSSPLLGHRSRSALSLSLPLS